MGPNREVRRASHSNSRPDTNEETEDVGLITVLQPYLEHYFSTRPFEEPCHADSTPQILQVYKIMRRLTDRYFAFTSRLLLGLSSSSRSSVLDYATGVALVAPLSRSEKTRLQRALLRYDLYSRPFPYEDGVRKVRSSISGKSQFDLFISHLERWEVDELCSIHRFLFNLATNYMGDLEDQFVGAYLSSPGTTPTPPTGIPGQTDHLSKKRTWWATNADDLEEMPSFASASHTRKRLRLQKVIDFTAMSNDNHFADMEQGRTVGLDLFDRFWQLNGMANFFNQLASLGLEFFSTLIDARTPGERCKKIRSLGRRHLHSRERDFLPEALTHLRGSGNMEDWEDGGNIEENIGCDNEEEDPTRPNTGYREFVLSMRQFSGMHWRFHHLKPRWSEMFDPSVNEFIHNLSEDPFLEQGCVFWDRARLVMFRRDLERIPQYFVGYKNGGWYEGRGLHRWKDRMSVDKRLKDIMIPEGQWMKLLDDFEWLN